MKKRIRRRYKLMRRYLKLKVAERDHHGVADAAMDLREMEAAFPWIVAEQDRKGWPK